MQIGKEISVINNSDSSEVYYRCVVGSFKERINAENRKEELIAKGYTDTFIEIYKKNKIKKMAISKYYFSFDMVIFINKNSKYR